MYARRRALMSAYSLTARRYADDYRASRHLIFAVRMLGHARRRQ